MEFNYLLLPCGDLARKRPTAGARGWTRQEGSRKQERRGTHFIQWQETGSPLFGFGKMSLWVWMMGGERYWSEGKQRCRQRKRLKAELMSVSRTHSHWEKRMNDNIYIFCPVFWLTHKSLFCQSCQTLTFIPWKHHHNYYVDVETSAEKHLLTLKFLRFPL